MGSGVWGLGFRVWGWGVGFRVEVRVEEDLQDFRVDQDELADRSTEPVRCQDGDAPLGG